MFEEQGGLSKGRGTLVGTLLSFICWKGTPEGNLSCFSGLQKGTLLFVCLFVGALGSVTHLLMSSCAALLHEEIFSSTTSNVYSEGKTWKKILLSSSCLSYL